MSDPLDEIIRICQDGQDSKLSRIANVLGFTEELVKDSARLDWLNEQIVDVIYLDDGSMIDARGNCVRTAIDAAMAKEKGQ